MTTQMLRRIVFLDRATFPDEIEIRPPQFDHELVLHDQTAIDQVAERIAGADIVITNKVKLSAETLAMAPNLKFIGVAATGYDVVDLAACVSRGITVSNIRNYAVNTVPEHTFGLILALKRSLLPYHRSVAAGRWAESGQFCYFDYPIHNLAGATLGIIGDGAIGQAVAAIGQAFGMRTLYAAYKGVQGMGPLYTPFEQVLAQSDVITMHAPLTPASHHMISTPEFDLMTRSPLIINTARGGLIDESALVAALDKGQISGAGFDVLTVEPPPADHPMMDLLSRDNVIITPHVAWSSREAIQALVDQLIDNVEAFAAGAPRNVVSH